MPILKQRLAICQISIVTAEKMVFTLFITPDLLIKKDLEYLNFRRCSNSHSSCPSWWRTAACRRPVGL